MLDLSTLNTGQHEAVFDNSDKILCLAGAGTGKTYSMIARIYRLVSEGVDPRSILVLTFTNAAAFEMKSRYESLNLSRLNPEFRTFHSFCYSLISSNKKLLNSIGYSKIPDIADDSEASKIERYVELQLGFKSLKSKSKSLKSKRENVSTPDPKKDWNQQLFEKTMKRELVKKNKITFDNLCYDVCDKFINNDDCILSYKIQYKYIFVDEFQDTDRLQWDFVQSFNNSRLFLVGDALQALYGFRGADSSIIKSVASDNNWKVVRLSENYRSCKCICDFANKNTVYANKSYKVDIVSNKPGGQVKVLESNGFKYRGIIHDDAVIDLLINASTFSGSTAILTRTNAEVDFIKKLYDENGLSYNTNTEDVSYLHVLKSVEDLHYEMEYLSTYLDRDKFSQYIREVATDVSYDLIAFLKQFGNVPAIDMYHNKIESIRMIYEMDIPLDIKLSQILLNIGIDYIGDYGKCESLNDLIDLIGSSIDPNKTATSVYIGTIHSVKGLEFDNVFLVGVDGASFRLISEEDCNVYYVGITRAKTNLCVIRGVKWNVRS